MDQIAKEAKERSRLKGIADAAEAERIANLPPEVVIDQTPEEAELAAARAAAALEAAAAAEAAAAEAAAYEAAGGKDQHWDSWVTVHRPGSASRSGVTWKKTLAQVPLLGCTDQSSWPVPQKGQWKAPKLLSMSNADLDASFAKDWAINIGAAAHRTQVRQRLGRTGSSPSSLAGSKPGSPAASIGKPGSPAASIGKPGTAPARVSSMSRSSISLPGMDLPVSAWQLWGKAGKLPVEQRDTWNDHALGKDQRLARKNGEGGGGEYCHNFMQSDVWSPKFGAFRCEGRPRTKCTFSEVAQTWRWHYLETDGLKRRIDHITTLDGYTRPIGIGI